jgi:hypothetical protein
MTSVDDAQRSGYATVVPHEYMLQARRRLIPAFKPGVLGELGWTYLEQQKEIEKRAKRSGLLKDDLERKTARTLGMERAIAVVRQPVLRRGISEIETEAQLQTQQTGRPRQRSSRRTPFPYRKRTSAAANRYYSAPTGQ